MAETIQDLVDQEILANGLGTEKFKTLTKAGNKYGYGASSSVLDLGSGDSPWYKNGDLLSGYAGLASSLVQLASLPTSLKLAKTQIKGLKQNIATAKEEQARRNKNIAGFNQPVSQLSQSAMSSTPSSMTPTKPTYSSFANSGI